MWCCNKCFNNLNKIYFIAILSLFPFSSKNYHRAVEYRKEMFETICKNIYIALNEGLRKDLRKT